MAITPEFIWADNAVKCERAREIVGKDASEQEVFEQYVKLAGRVINGGLSATVPESEAKPKAKKSKKAKK